MLARLVVAAGVSLGLLGCGGNDPTTTKGPVAAKDIVELAQATDSLSTLVKALTAADLVETLKTAGPFTVFAPNNAAFDALPDGALDAMLNPANKAKLVSLLKFHVLAGTTKFDDLTTGEVDTLEGIKKLQISNTSDSVTIGTNAAEVVTADILASNGVVHIINKVLHLRADIVELAQATDSLSTLVKALTAADLVETLKTAGPFTVFAPNNAAFDALPDGALDAMLNPANKADLVSLLKFHVLAGATNFYYLNSGEVDTLEAGKKLQITKTGDEVVTIGTNAAEVVTPNRLASNGVVHIINKVLDIPTKLVTLV